MHKDADPVTSPCVRQHFVVGLTGGVGSGKSAAAQCFAERGATVVDTDLLAHQLTAADGAAMPAIREAFGASVVAADGALDRAAMRHIVFGDSQARLRLESILHPMIRSRSDEEVAHATGPYVVLVVPLLVESGAYRARCDRIVVVDAPELLQIERVMARSKLTAQEVRAIMATQAARDIRCAAANDIIDNGDSFDSLRHQVDVLHAFYLTLAEKRASVNSGGNRGSNRGDNPR